MTQRVVVLLDVLFVCGSNAYTQALWNFTSRVLGLVLFPLQDQHVECRICGVFHNMHHLQFLLQVLLNLSCCITILVSYFSVRVEDCKQCTSL
ncbi:hypothetical protein CY35_01G008600 [Sphagnum magellanicum]|nr:hypothetical protein CY35_01G008600 [Sphagnum magellanicum]